MALLRHGGLRTAVACPVFIPPRADEWLVFHGEASPAEARVYIKVRVAADVPKLKLTGTIHGPASRYARTLQATTRFERPIIDAESLVEVILPDPCFWSPAAPYLYTAKVQLELAGERVWADERTFGIRRLGAQNERLYFDAQNWVLRGAAAANTSAIDWDAWREHDLAAVVDNPSDAFCAEADVRGLLVVAQCDATGQALHEQLANWQRHPSIGIVVLSADTQLSPSDRGLAPNTLLAARCERSDSPTPEWADISWQLESAHIANAPTSQARRRARIIERPSAATEPAAARVACDTTQRDWAGRGRIAGFVAGQTPAV